MYDQEDPPKKKHKVSSPEGHQTRGPFYQVIDVSVGSNTCSSVSNLHSKILIQNLVIKTKELIFQSVVTTFSTDY